MPPTVPQCLHRSLAAAVRWHSVGVIMIDFHTLSSALYLAWDIFPAKEEAGCLAAMLKMLYVAEGGVRG